ncbi:MAG: response regulator transcription factor [Chloroflexi bacterium]|nr:response regulator transcription factor [Chloroflexota bacterium]
MAEPSVTILVVDDQPVFCGLVREMLAPSPEFQVVGEAHDGGDALRLVEELQPQAVLLDVEMPGLHGLKVASEIHVRFPHVSVVLMSAYHQREYREAALRSGASDFIPKMELSVERLRRAFGLENPP